MNPIEEFYKDSTILITGANGFLGTVLVEKLLRCFDVKKIYILMRAKNNQSVKERIENYVNHCIFDSLREENPLIMDKLKAVEVDYSAADLSIEPAMLERLHSEVQIVFNVVASVKFNMLLKDAIDINLLGTKKVVNLVLGIEKLKSFVHVSTLYSNCNRLEVDEKIYEHILNYHQLVPIANVLKNVADKEPMESFLLQKLPNTYTLSKHFAEKLVYHQAFFMPAGIFRPPVVISNYKDLPGYTDNLNGPSGIVAWTVKGFIHIIYGNSKIRSNMVPVDYVINALVATAWDIHENFQGRILKFSNMPIYNYIFQENNLTWGKYMSLVPLGFRQPLKKFIWYYSYFIVNSKVLFKILNFIYHTIPASLMDFVALIIGKRMMYRKAYSKTEKILIMMSYFGTRQWTFHNKNVQSLVEKTKDFRFQRGNMDFDMRNINWSEYFRNYIPGIKRYFLKEDCDDVRALKSSYQWMKRLHMTVKYFAYVLIGLIVLNSGKNSMLQFLFKFLVK